MILTEVKKKRKKKMLVSKAQPHPGLRAGTSINFPHSDRVLLSTASVRSGTLQVAFTVFHNLLCGRVFWLGPECSPKLGMTPTVSQIQLASTLLLLSARHHGFAGFMSIRLLFCIENLQDHKRILCPFSFKLHRTRKKLQLQSSYREGRTLTA